MPFTLQELESIANATLDHYIDRGKIHSQTIQDKPLLSKMMSMSKSFAAGKEFLSVAVKGEYSTSIQGFSGDQTVGFSKPNNIKRARYPYKNIHAGIEVTYDELQKNGISVIETSNGRSTSNHSGREMTALANLLDDKLEDMAEGRERGINEMFWRDGTADSSLVPGIKSIILTDPTSATIVGGIDQSSNTWWRNRAVTGISTASPSNSTIAQVLQKEVRQLKRYAKGVVRHQLYAGSDFLDALETELRVNGNYTDRGWASQGQIDVSVADVSLKGVTINYDPTLDDEGEAKFLYIIDHKRIYPMWMEGEKAKRHSPARPYDKYVLYRSMTDSLGLVCSQRNTSGVYSIA